MYAGGLPFTDMTAACPLVACRFCARVEIPITTVSCCCYCPLQELIDDLSNLASKGMDIHEFLAELIFLGLR